MGDDAAIHKHGQGGVDQGHFRNLGCGSVDQILHLPRESYKRSDHPSCSSIVEVFGELFRLALTAG